MLCIKCKKDMPVNALYCPWCGRKQEKSANTRRRGNGTGTVFRRGNTWTAQVTLYTVGVQTENGVKVRRKYRTKGGFATKKEAVMYLEALRSGEERRCPTLLELYSQWEKTDMPKLSRDKQTAYRKARERLDGIIGRKIDSVTTAQLQFVVDENAASYYTARDMKTLLSHLYKKALPDQFVTQNLAQYIVLPDLGESEAEAYSEVEVAKMWAAYADGDTFVGYMLLMIYSGMMPGELLACRKDMIDLDKCEIYGCGKKTKTRKTQALAFSDRVRPVVEELVNTAQGDKLVSLRRDAWYDEYHKTTVRIGVRDLPPYSCRHTTGTMAAESNLNAAIIQKVMRHAKITTSQRYIHLGEATTHDALNTMADDVTYK